MNESTGKPNATLTDSTGKLNATLITQGNLMLH
jgi:hypothetical protein